MHLVVYSQEQREQTQGKASQCKRTMFEVSRLAVVISWSVTLTDGNILHRTAPVHP
jgi:hypothetical protein